MSVQNWPYKTAFYQRVERFSLHGLHFQHVTLCARRAWLYLHQVNFAQWHERVMTGLAKHLVSYGRDHSTEGLLGLAPDRIDWQQCIVYENKGSAGAQEAADNQTAFYAVMLAIATDQEWQAYAHILSSRKRRLVVLDEQRLACLWRASEQLEALAQQSMVPAAKKMGLCASCSACGFCGYDD